MSDEKYFEIILWTNADNVAWKFILCECFLLVEHSTVCVIIGSTVIRNYIEYNSILHCLMNLKMFVINVVSKMYLWERCLVIVLLKHSHGTISIFY